MVEALAAQVAECGGVGYSNVSLRAELKFASLYVGGYPVRINRIVLVDVTMVVRVVLKALKRALPVKMRNKFALSRSTDGDLYKQHVPRAGLPRFLGGDGGEGQLLVERTIAHWSELHEARAAWEASLVSAYGEGFKTLRPDMP